MTCSKQQFEKEASLILNRVSLCPRTSWTRFVEPLDPYKLVLKEVKPVPLTTKLNVHRSLYIMQLLQVKHKIFVQLVSENGKAFDLCMRTTIWPPKCYFPVSDMQRVPKLFSYQPAQIPPAQDIKMEEAKLSRFLFLSKRIISYL